MNIFKKMGNALWQRLAEEILKTDDLTSEITGNAIMTERDRDQLLFDLNDDLEDYRDYGTFRLFLAGLLSAPLIPVVKGWNALVVWIGRNIGEGS